MNPDQLRQWDIDRAKPVNRWFLRHVYYAPGGFFRFIGFLLLVCTVIWAIITVVVTVDPYALQSDKEFWPFITIFFGVCSALAFAGWFIAWVRAKLRSRREHAAGSGA